MSQKGKGVVFEPRLGYGVGVFDDSRLKLKHQALVQDYHDLQKEDNVRRSKLEAAKQRERVLAAEVRFLQKRYKYLMETKGVNISSEEQRHVQQPFKSGKQFKTMKDHLMSRNEATQHRLPPLPVQKKSTKNHYVTKKVIPPFGSPVATDQRLTKLLHGKVTITNSLNSVSVLDHNGRMHVGNDTVARKAIMGFDLNQGSGSTLLTRAPIFDLNEISTGDDDFQSSLEAVKIEEAKGLRRGLNDEQQQQNDFKFSICRNSDEGSSRVEKKENFLDGPTCFKSLNFEGISTCDVILLLFVFFTATLLVNVNLV